MPRHPHPQQRELSTQVSGCRRSDLSSPRTLYIERGLPLLHHTRDAVISLSLSLPPSVARSSNPVCIRLNTSRSIAVNAVRRARSTKPAAKMLAVFSKAVANGPEELCSPCSSSSTRAVEDNRKSGTQILDAFVKEAPTAIQITLGDVGGMAYTHHKQALLRPRSFAAIDGVFCMFQGNLENLTALRQEYGLAKNVNEVMLIIQAYKTLRDRGPFPADKVVAALVGHFGFILYDTSNRVVFVAQDCEGKVPFYWGTAADKSLAFSDTSDVLKACCGKSFAPFPAGCYFSSNMGLKSYEHPLQKLKPVPRVDSQGQALGAAFKVDMNHKDKDLSMPRVGSEANWAQSI